jgi:hypothetical protein
MPICRNDFRVEELETDTTYRVSERGTAAARWDRDTWPHLERLARDHPEAGIHFQSNSDRLSHSRVTDGL